MLNDRLQQLVRAAGGDALLLDARQHRGLVTDTSDLITMLKNLRNDGFTRFIDFTAHHLGAKPNDDNQLAERFALFLILRAPKHGHAQLTLKWNWPGAIASGRGVPPWRDGSQGGTSTAPTDDEPSAAVDVDADLAALGVASHAFEKAPALEELASGNGDATHHEPPTSPQTGYNKDDGAGQPDGEPSPAGPVTAHPTLSHIWPAAGLAEREIFEMTGIPFAGHDNLAPLLLDEQFVGFPLRRDYEPPKRPDYAGALLKSREEQALLGLALAAQRGTPMTKLELEEQRAQMGSPQQDDDREHGGSRYSNNDNTSGGAP
ncbi:NADH-quinone oxidoreductase subunit C [bacterium]|nr:NADH-quinone oxidoreductase subunit C [bacterium]